MSARSTNAVSMRIHESPEGLIELALTYRFSQVAGGHHEHVLSMFEFVELS